MPSKECHVMDERLRFVARLLEGREDRAVVLRRLRRTLQHGPPPIRRRYEGPADLYTRSGRVYRGVEELTYPFHDQTIAVAQCGRICLFAWRNIGVTQVGERIWLVTFMQHDLGYFDDRPVARNRSRIRLDRNCYPSARNELLPIGSERTSYSWWALLDLNQ